MNHQDEFSVNELEANQVDNIVTPVDNDDYHDGPTARELLVNSVRVDKKGETNKKGLVVLGLILLVTGIGFFLSRNEKKTEEVLNLPDWANVYVAYFNEYMKNTSLFKVYFVDLDFTGDPEAIVKYSIDGEDKCHILQKKDNSVLVTDIVGASEFQLMYSMSDKKVKWMIDMSTSPISLVMVDANLRINGQVDESIDVYNGSDINLFKSNNLNVTFDMKFTDVRNNNISKNLLKAISQYEEDEKELDALVISTIQKYSNLN